MGYLGTKPANAAVTSEQIADGAVSTADIAANAVTAAKMGSNGTWAPTGTIIQVVQGASNTPASNSSTTVNSSTGVSASITPKFSTSKILINVSINGIYTGATTQQGAFYLYKNGTSFLNLALYVGNSTSVVTSVPASVIDTSVATSSTTYAVYFKCLASGSITVNQSSDYSSITLTEIA